MKLSRLRVMVVLLRPNILRIASSARRFAPSARRLDPSALRPQRARRRNAALASGGSQGELQFFSARLTAVCGLNHSCAAQASAGPPGALLFILPSNEPGLRARSLSLARKRERADSESASLSVCEPV